MSNINTEGLPPEMQARIADIIEKAKSSARINMTFGGFAFCPEWDDIVDVDSC